MGESLGVSSGIAVVPATYVDAFYVEDVPDGPDDAEETAYHNHDDLYGEAHRRVAGRGGLQVLHHSFVDLKHMGFE